MAIFNDDSEFVLMDNRRFRTFSPITAEQLEKKHAALLPPSLLREKSVLDLGNALGATGHWCLSHGARSYTGVELQEEYVTTSRILLEKYHPGRFEIHHEAIEDFLKRSSEQYDIVLALGVLYVFTDQYRILRKIAEATRECIAIEGLYPDLSRVPRNFNGIQFFDEQRINLADENASLLGRGARISPAGLAFLLAEFSFTSEEGPIVPEPILKTEDLYREPASSRNVRYLMRFVRSQGKATGLSSDLAEGRRSHKVLW